MNTPLWISILISAVPVVIAVVSAVAAWWAWRVSRKMFIYQVLASVQHDYRSPEMLHAVDSLWQLYRDSNQDENTLVEKYNTIRIEQMSWVQSQAKEKEIECVQATLHCQRRTITSFYQHLASLYIYNLISGKIIYRTWGEKTLRIIPKILVPIENSIRKEISGPESVPLDDKCDLMVLYGNSK